LKAQPALIFGSGAFGFFWIGGVGIWDFFPYALSLLQTDGRIIDETCSALVSYYCGYARDQWRGSAKDWWGWAKELLELRF
jgi:hypothetical protein